MRRWRPNQTVRVAGLQLRIVPGYKSSDDLRLEWRTAGAWAAVPMAAAAILTDFFCENEGVLYPPPAAGGEYFLRYLRVASEQGWEAADAWLKDEQQAKRQREAPLIAAAVAPVPQPQWRAEDFDEMPF